MRNIIFTMLLTLFSFVANAQIFTQKTVSDKFDDVVSTENKKTLITQTDSTFVIEEKGEKPRIYWIVDEIHKIGDKEKPANLIDDVYGYEINYTVVEDSDFEKYSEDDVYENHVKILTHRVVSKTPIVYNFYCEFVWLRLEDSSRVIYKR